MELDTQKAESLAGSFLGLKRSHYFTDPDLQARHNSIQNRLDSLYRYFKKLSDLGWECENQLMNKMPYTGAIPAGFHAQGSISGNSVSSILKGNPIKATGSASYALGAAQSVMGHSGWGLQAHGELLSVAGYGEAKLRVLDKNKKLNPALNLNGQVMGSLASAGLAAGYQNGSFQAGASLNGEVGAVYGKAEAVLSKDQIKVDAAVGAAAARGECTAVINLFGLATVSLTLEGSLCSAEAGFSWSFSNKEWQVGAKLGFIAGLGFRIRVTTP